MDAGVIIDCGRIETGPHPKEPDDWWLDLYVMLSRATRLEDLLLMRAPPASFLLRGPPASLRLQLDKFAARTDKPPSYPVFARQSQQKQTYATFTVTLGFALVQLK